MPNGFDLSLDETQIDADTDKLIRQYLTAGRDAVGSTTRTLERRLEMATMQAVPGRMWRAWKSEVYPRSGPARDPVGTVFLNGSTRTKAAMTYWMKQGSARSRNGGYFAIPLPAAGSRGRSRMLTPVEFEAQHNVELRPVFRPGKAPLLVMDAAVLSGRAQIARPNTKGRIAKGRGSVTVPIFVLVPLIHFAGTVSVDALVEMAMRELPENYAHAIASVR